MKDSRELIDKEKQELLEKEKQKEIDRAKQFINNTFKTKDGLNTLIWLAGQCGYNQLSVGKNNEFTYLNEGKKFVLLSILAGLDKETTLAFQKALLTNSK